jgi:hypothetical protein
VLISKIDWSIGEIKCLTSSVSDELRFSYWLADYNCIWLEEEEFVSLIIPLLFKTTLKKSSKRKLWT